MRPADFRSFAEQVADRAGFDRTRLILGGDHLGPNPWRTLEPETAVAHALEMVAEYAAAGFSKIHLDASMPCGGEATLTDETVAARAARCVRRRSRRQQRLDCPGRLDRNRGADAGRNHE